MKHYLPASPFFEEGDYTDWEIKNLREKYKDNSQALRIINAALQPRKEMEVKINRVLKSEPLTDEQVEHWRKVLFLQFGPYALIMPREQIQSYRDKMQALANLSE